MEHTIRILIADDELYSRDELKHLLSVYPSLHVVGEADTGEAAVMKALQLQPDVVFLDIEMPRMNGMDAAKSMRELKKVPLIVFATAYPEFAVEAFRCDATDYLLKPYDEGQLHQTVQRIQKHFQSHKETEAGKQLGRLAIEVDGEILYLDPKEVLYISREEKFTKITTKTNEYESKLSLKELETRLQPYSFFRIHKSYLVNLDYITRLTPWFNGAYQLELKDRSELLAVSRNYVKALRAQLEI